MRDSRGLDLIIDRMKYLGDKRLSDLSTAEIEEYLELCNYLYDLHTELKDQVRNQVRNMWDNIKTYWE